MNACPTCGKQHEPTIRFCPDDGTPLSETALFPGPHTPTSPKTVVKVELTLPVVVGERYKLTEVRGGGGMAKVYRAVDQTLEREVAVKIINAELRADPEFDARFQREARIASQLSDPHIVVVHDYGIDTSHGPFLVMEFLQGTTLRERLQSQGNLPVNAATQLWEQLLLALIHAHGKGIVHRDIKPDNLFLLSQSGVRMHLRVLDFGIARMLRRGEITSDSHTLTSPGAVLGTPRYMSPEQLAGQTVDARSDLYSSAVVIHEALTGDLPYVTSRKLSETCSQAPVSLQRLVEHCLKPNPDERPANAEEVYRRLQEENKEVDESEDSSEEHASSPQNVISQQATTLLVPPKSVTSRRKLKIALFAGLFIVVLSGVVGTIKDCSKADKYAMPEQETLIGVQIGIDRDGLIAAIGKAPEKDQPHGNPWKGDHKEALGHILKPEDVQDEEKNLDDLDMLLWSNGDQCALLRKGTVLAFVVRHQREASSGRGIKIGSSLKEVEDRYPLDQSSEINIFAVKQDELASGWMSTLKDKSSKKATSGKAYRYDGLGIGFAIVNEKVTAIALFPARAPNESSP
jgi:eukaryotic-like serine/threonine-protein kinase